MENMDDLKKELLAAVTAAADMKSLEEVRVSVLGKKRQNYRTDEKSRQPFNRGKKGEGPEPQYSEVGSGTGA